jgi:hypothetical protein
VERLAVNFLGISASEDQGACRDDDESGRGCKAEGQDADGVT